jgi:carbamoyl-phosphate synthase small subunit
MPEVSTAKPEEYGDRSKDCVVVIDTGVKYSIIRNIMRTGYRVVCLPWDATYEQVMSYNPKGVVLSNGPGDPKVCRATIKTATKLIKTSTPTLGICLGNQILALAGGADTYKLKFGHRGQNKPCVDLRNNMAYVTSQNHGYGIDPKTLAGTGFKVWFSNADDKTVEGIEHASKPVIAVQFHPEASPGPYDCMFVFDRFKEIIKAGKMTGGVAKTAKKRQRRKG